MDELLSPYSFSPPWPASTFFSHAGHPPVMEFASYEVPEQWLLGDVVAAKNEGYDYDHIREEMWPVGSTLSLTSELSEQPAPLQQEPSVTAHAQRPAGKRRGRKPGQRPDGPSVSHVEAERQRWDKLNRLFCDVRAAVPTVSRMDKASLLAYAAAYIAKLRARVARLEAEAKLASATRWEPISAGSCGGAAGGGGVHKGVEVRMVGPDAAAVRATSAAPHAPARLMGALRALGLRVQHACVSRVNGVTVQDVVVDVPAELQDDDGLRTSLVQMLQDS
jgi:hypothetical protein